MRNYEISLWQDRYVTLQEMTDRELLVLKELINSDAENLVNFRKQLKEDKKFKGFIFEDKICVLGSDKTTTSLSAMKPELTRKTDGSITLQFQMSLQYRENNIGELKHNFLVDKIAVESKIKLYYKEKWYDFIVKNIDTESKQQLVNFTCESLFIEELSGNGFNIEFDNELENNMGTITKLAKIILEETDWDIDLENSDIIVQQNEEPLYEIVLSEDVSAKKIGDTDIIKTFNKGTHLYCFFSNINKKSSDVQFLEKDNLENIIDSKDVISGPNFLTIRPTSYDSLSSTIPKPTFAETMHLVKDLRGNKLVRKPKVIFDKSANRYVNIFQDTTTNKEVYGYTETKYPSNNIKINWATNGQNFVNTDGWIAYGKASVSQKIYPNVALKNIFKSEKFFSYLSCDFNNNFIMENGFYTNKSRIENLIKGDKIFFKIKYHLQSGDSYKKPNGNELNIQLRQYEIAKDTKRVQFIGEPLGQLQVLTSVLDNDEEVFFGLMELNSNLAYADLIRKKYNLFISSNISNTIWIEEFVYTKATAKIGENLNDYNNLEKPGDLPSQELRVYYKIYEPQDADKPEEIIADYYGTKLPSKYKMVYNETCEKVRSITEKESNRFNLLQTLCETFECWAKFSIKHDKKTGRILLDKNYNQIKKVAFKKYVGKENFAGFKGDINLSNIKKTIDSKDIVSKMIVKPNTNQYAKNKFCTIARGQENYSKENFILNFDYYVRQGLIDFSELNNDLYLESGEYLGYYTVLHRLNERGEDFIDNKIALQKTIDNLSSSLKIYSESVEKGLEEITQKKAEFEKFTGYNFDIVRGTYNNTVLNPYSDPDIDRETAILRSPEAEKIGVYILTLEHTIENYKILADVNYQRLYGKGTSEDPDISSLCGKLKIYESKIKEIRNNKKQIHKEFYEKYSRFIKEGTWTSQDYLDDSLYYLDAYNIAKNSGIPKVTYNINVLDLSDIIDYDLYQFDIGDKTYIEDVEFFGYDPLKAIKTPYKEEIIISEIKEDLSDPSKNTITVQNYKTQFEDLFQRITATVQQVQLREGEIASMGRVITPTGELNTNVLQESLMNNDLILKSTKNNSIILNDDGLTATNLTAPNELVRLTSLGLVLSNDGGKSWKVGITGNGINTALLKSGQIDANKINIMSGAFPAFRWDSHGINAYEFSLDEITGAGKFFDFNKFVRFDQYGLYGLDGATENFNPGANPETALKSIKEKAKFGLTWDGFFLKTHAGKGGGVEISDKDDIVVYDDTSIKRIQIGLLENNDYGIQLKNNKNLPVLRTTNDGSLYLQNQLLIGPTEYSPRVKLGIVQKFNERNEEISHSSNSATYSKVMSIKDSVNNSKDKTRRLEPTESFALYDDGRLEAKDVILTGHIEATSGQIGNLKVEEVKNLIDNIVISTKDGSIFSVYDNQATPESITLNALKKDNLNDSGIYTWEENQNGKWVTIGNGPTYTLSYDSNRFDNNLLMLRVSYLIDGEKYYSKPYFINIIEIPNSDKTRVELSTVPTEVIIYKNEDENISRKIEFSSEYVVNTIYKDNFSKKIQDNVDNYNFDVKIRKTSEFDAKWYSLTDESVSVSSATFPNPFLQLIEISHGELTNYSINLGKLFTITSEDNTVKSYIKEVVDLIIQDSCIMKIDIKEKGIGNIVASTIVLIRESENDENATLTLKSSGIEAAIQNHKLTFNSSGVKIQNGGITILDNDGERIFGVDEDSLYFKGGIDATYGSFHGTIQAISGTLGDMNLTNSLSIGSMGFKKDANEEFIFESNNFSQENGTGFKIDEKGNIIANSLVIGNSTTIQKYLKIGESWILNTNEINNFNRKELDESLANNGDFIKVNYINPEGRIENAITINQLGYISIGGDNNKKGIKIDGKNNYIASQSYLNSGGTNGWKIDDENAVFNNIIARGAIKSSVFEYDMVHAIGGKMIVRPSTLIRSYITNSTGQLILEVDDIIGFEDNDWCRIDLGINNFVIVQIQVSNISSPFKSSVLIKNGDIENLQLLTGATITNFGKNKSVGIGINGTNDPTLFPANALSVFETEEKNGDINLSPKVIVGKLPNLPNYGELIKDSYGLFAKNAVLEGSLVAFSNGLSAGISTNSGAIEKDSHFPINNKGEILFWGGAKSNNSEDIEKAPFRVDKYGNLYAGSGYFNGTIITNSIIEAAEIRTAVLTGRANDGNDAALTIKDTRYGIHFTENGKDKLLLNSDKMYVNMDLIMGEGCNLVSKSKLEPKELVLRNNELGPDSVSIKLEQNVLGFIRDSDKNTQNYLGYITYKNKGLNTIINNNATVRFEEDKTVFNSDVYFNNSISIGDLELVQVETTNGEKIGYNIYVR